MGWKRILLKQLINNYILDIKKISKLVNSTGKINFLSTISSRQKYIKLQVGKTKLVLKIRIVKLKKKNKQQSPYSLW